LHGVPYAVNSLDGGAWKKARPRLKHSRRRCGVSAHPKLPHQSRGRILAETFKGRVPKKSMTLCEKTEEETAEDPTTADGAKPQAGSAEPHIEEEAAKAAGSNSDPPEEAAELHAPWTASGAKPPTNAEVAEADEVSRKS